VFKPIGKTNNPMCSVMGAHSPTDDMDVSRVIFDQRPRLRMRGQTNFATGKRGLMLVIGLSFFAAVGAGASRGFLVPAIAGPVFLFGAAQHGEGSLRTQVSAGDDDRIQESHRRDVGASE
jgi:hypothetical protein